MTLGSDGWEWKLAWVDAQYQEQDDYQELQAWIRGVGISFRAHPLVSKYPWSAHKDTNAKHIAKALRKQRTKRSKLHNYYNLNPMIAKLNTRGVKSEWGQASLKQSPAQLWNRDGLYTDFQNWTLYRIALGILNLCHPGWPQNRECPDQQCPCHEETIDHLVWECDKAKAAWTAWIRPWMGGQCTDQQVSKSRSAAASRQAPPVAITFLAFAQQCIGRWTYQHTEAMNSLWQVWSTTTPAMLWRLRVDAVFKGNHSNKEVTTAAVNTAGQYQVQAIASAWKRNPVKRIQGICLDTCQQIMNIASRHPLPKQIQAWVLDLAYKKTAQGNWNGGCVLYQHSTDTTWVAIAASSLMIAPHHSQTEVVEQVIHDGLQQLQQETGLHSVFLRINTLDKKIRKQLGKQDDNMKELRAIMNKTFGIIWEQPSTARLKAAKFLATLGTTQNIDMKATNTSAISDFIRKSAPQHSASVVGATRKTPDIVSRLSAYQASIENKK